MGDRVLDAVLGIDGDLPERVGGVFVRFGDHADFRAEAVGDVGRIIGFAVEGRREVFRGFRVDDGLLVVTVGSGAGEEGCPFGFQGIDLNPILRAFWAGDSGFHRGEIHIDDL